MTRDILLTAVALWLVAALGFVGGLSIAAQHGDPLGVCDD